MKKSCKINFDGACKGNPGPMGIGLTIFDLDKNKYVLKLGKKINEGTNNLAELSACYVALKFAIKLNYSNIEVNGDSKFIINSINKNWKIKATNLIKLFSKIRIILSEHINKNISFKWIPREKNVEADYYSNNEEMFIAKEIKYEKKY